MTELVNYLKPALIALNSPHLVAQFQKVFGIESHFNTKHSEDLLINEYNSAFNNQNKPKDLANGNVVKNELNGIKPNEAKQRSAQRIETNQKIDKCPAQNETNVETIGASNSSVKKLKKDTSNKSHKRQSSNAKMLINNTDHSHIVAKTTIHSRFWYYFFHLGASMGVLFSSSFCFHIFIYLKFFYFFNFFKEMKYFIAFFFHFGFGMLIQLSAEKYANKNED